MAKQKDFDSFISNIEPSKTTVSYISSVQNNLREYLENHSEYKDIHKDTFLSGSYAKHTSIRPKKDDSKRDVDIIVVTNYSQDDNSINVLEELQSVLKEKDLYKTAKVQSHSVGIELENISLSEILIYLQTSIPFYNNISSICLFVYNNRMNDPVISFNRLTQTSA